MGEQEIRVALGHPLPAPKALQDPPHHLASFQATRQLDSMILKVLSNLNDSVSKAMTVTPSLGFFLL